MAILCSTGSCSDPASKWVVALCCTFLNHRKDGVCFSSISQGVRDCMLAVHMKRLLSARRYPSLTIGYKSEDVGAHPKLPTFPCVFSQIPLRTCTSPCSFSSPAATMGFVWPRRQWSVSQAACRRAVRAGCLMESFPSVGGLSVTCYMSRCSFCLAQFCALASLHDA